MRRNKNSKIDFSKAWFSKAFRRIFREMLPHKTVLLHPISALILIIKRIVQITSIFSFMCLCSRNISPKAFPAHSKRPKKQPSQVCFVMVLLQGNCGYQPDMLKNGERVISGLVTHARLKATQILTKLLTSHSLGPSGLPSLENMVKNCSVIMWKVHN